MRSTENKTWQHELEELIVFVDETETIVITPTVLSFYSKEAKAEFYRRLDLMTKMLVARIIAEENLVDYVGIQSFRQVEESLCKKTDIEGIKLPQALEEYTHDPFTSAAKFLQEPSIELLRQKMSVEEYESRVRLLLVALFDDFNRYIFETWLTYGLIDSLDPVAFKKAQALGENNFLIEDAKLLEVGFQYPLKNVRLPEALFKTALGEVYAYKFEQSSEVESYSEESKCKDRTAAGNTAETVCHRTLLLYRVDDFDRIPVLAQRKMRYLLEPSLIVEHLGVSDLISTNVLQWVHERVLIFGEDAHLQVVLAGPQDPVLLDEIAASYPFTFHTLSYDQSLLANILESL